MPVVVILESINFCSENQLDYPGKQDRRPTAKKLRKIPIPTVSPCVEGNLRVADHTNGKRTKMDQDRSE